jgi:Integrase zinc binding domain
MHEKPQTKLQEFWIKLERPFIWSKRSVIVKQKSDQKLGQILNNLETLDSTDLPNCISRLKVVHRLLYQLTKPSWKLRIPQCLVTSLITTVHDKTGHFGINKTEAIIRSTCFWPGMSTDIRAIVSECIICHKTKIKKGKTETDTCFSSRRVGGSRSIWPFT